MKYGAGAFDSPNVIGLFSPTSISLARNHVSLAASRSYTLISYLVIALISQEVAQHLQLRLLSFCWRFMHGKQFHFCKSEGGYNSRFISSV